VIHAIKPPLRQFNEYIKETKEINEKFYKALIPTLKEYGVFCAIENLFGADKNWNLLPSVCSTAEELAEYIDICDDRFVCCLDIGHVNVVAQHKGFEQVNYKHMCEVLGDKIQVLHVHDNNGIKDQHLIPFAGNVDWNEVVKGLKSIGYSGNLSLETFYFMQQIKSECFATGMSMMYMAGKRIYDMFMRQI
jgi:sugar phosphate isomerase/epimerase